MAEAQTSKPTDETPDPAAERLRRKLVRFMAINLGILFIALMAVVIAIVYRAFLADPGQETAMAEIPAPPPGSMLTGEITLPDGASVVSHALSGNRLTLDIEADGTRAILIYDISQGRMIGRFDLSGAQ